MNQTYMRGLNNSLDLLSTTSGEGCSKASGKVSGFRYAVHLKMELKIKANNLSRKLTTLSRGGVTFLKICIKVDEMVLLIHSAVKCPCPTGIAARWQNLA